MFVHNGTFSYLKFPVNDTKSDSKKYMENIIENLNDDFWTVPGINALIDISLEYSRIGMLVRDSFISWGDGWVTEDEIQYSNKYYCESRYKSAHKPVTGYHYGSFHSNEDDRNQKKIDRRNKKKGKDVGKDNRNSWVEKFVNGTTYRYNEELKIWLPYSYNPCYHASSNVQLFTTEEYEKLDNPTNECNICSNILKEQVEWKRGLCYHCQMITMSNASDYSYEQMLRDEKEYVSNKQLN